MPYTLKVVTTFPLIAVNLSFCSLFCFFCFCFFFLTSWNFPDFGKNAIKECRCYCCDSDPLNITHLESPEGEEVEGSLLSSSVPLTSTHTHTHAHTSTRIFVFFWLCHQCAQSDPLCCAGSVDADVVSVSFFFVFLFYILYKSWCLFVCLFLLLSPFLSVSERSTNWAINIRYSRRPTFPGALQ